MTDQTETAGGHDDVRVELEKLREHVRRCHQFQNNVAHILGVETDWDDKGRKSVEHAAMRTVGNLAEARRDLDAMRPRANGAARELADLRDELATAREETVAAHELAEMRAEDRTELDTKLEDVTAERDDLSTKVGETVRILREAGVHHGEGLAERVRNLVAERNQLKARIGNALAEAGREYPLGRVRLDEIPTAAQICDRIRAALQGDQPAEPVSAVQRMNEFADDREPPAPFVPAGDAFPEEVPGG